MRRRLPVVILTIILVGTWGSLGVAGEMRYSLEKAERGFYVPSTGPPSSTAVAADALIGRPVGLATTFLGAGLFIATLPFSIPSRSVGTSARGLVGDQGGWTFCRPMGKSDPRYDRPGIFK
ncbi:MAG: hypothetical protein A3K23_00915 [Desulfobacca sp. RBG_16_58_9]|nr:MAG: hypothetical protein A3K23_00915 [Desulfobacca sp. RBG_16_58_9]